MLKIFEYFLPNGQKKNEVETSAAQAKSRLQVVVGYQRASEQVDYLPKLQREIMEVINKYVKINPDQVKVHLDQSEDCSILELNVTLPDLETLEPADEAVQQQVSAKKGKKNKAKAAVTA